MPDLLSTVDGADIAARLGGRLREAGVPVTPDRSARLLRALALAPPSDRSGLYWLSRVTLVSSQAQLPAFDAVFGALFDGLADPADSRGDPAAPPSVSDRPPRTPTATGPGRAGSAATGGAATAGVAAAGSTTRDVAVAAASRLERLATTSFASLTPAELAQLREVLRALVLHPPVRRARRRRPASHGDRLDLRRTLRGSLHSGGDPVRLRRTTRTWRPRRLVLLCDISGSMEAFALAYLHLLQGAVSSGRAEAFVFATRLTRLTRVLGGADPDRALARAAAAAPDWSGGTRLGEGLAEFLDSHGRRGLARGAVVVILSDGMDRGDPALVGEQMARLRRLAHRIVLGQPAPRSARLRTSGRRNARRPAALRRVRRRRAASPPLPDVIDAITEPNRGGADVRRRSAGRP